MTHWQCVLTNCNRAVQIQPGLNILDGRVLVVTGEVANQRLSARLLASAFVALVVHERRVTVSGGGQSVDAIRIRQTIVFHIVKAAS